MKWWRMELGQSTVLGLAIVGDAGGVDEAEYHKVGVCVDSLLPVLSGAC